MNPSNHKTPDLHHRRSIRLKEYDYSQPGAYFITICTHQREHLFGEIVDGIMQLNEFGQIAHEEWHKTARIRVEIELDEFVIMPNHFHGIVIIHEPVRAYRDTPKGGVGDTPVRAYGHTPLPTPNPTTFESPSRTLGAIVRGFKSAVTTQINQKRCTPGNPVWQRNYWEHIIRDKKDLYNVQAYILNNPIQWENDRYYSGGTK